MYLATRAKSTYRTMYGLKPCPSGKCSDEYSKRSTVLLLASLVLVDHSQPEDQINT